MVRKELHGSRLGGGWSWPESEVGLFWQGEPPAELRVRARPVAAWAGRRAALFGRPPGPKAGWEFNS
jgi:hypothetical protein